MIYVRPDAFHDTCQSIHLLHIYQRVKLSGMPNMLGVRELVPSQLRHTAWSQIATGHPHDEYVIAGIMFGFPLHYVGPPLVRPNWASHPSADSYQHQLIEYVEV